MNLTIKPRGKAGTYYAHFVDRHGRRQRISTKTSDKALAEERAYDLLREYLADDTPIGKRGRLTDLTTLAEALEYTYERRWRHAKSAAQIRVNIDKIAREFGHTPLARINRDSVTCYIEGLGLKDGTKNSYASFIKVAYDTVREETGGLLREVRFPHWKVYERKSRFVTSDEEEKIIAFIESMRSEAEPKWAYLRDLFVVLIDSGMRCGEVLGIHLGNLQNGGEAVWLANGSTKVGEGRLVPLTTRAQAALKRLLGHPYHGTWSSTQAGQAWRCVVRRLKLEDITLHTLRHTCASRLVQSGIDLYEASKMLGHSHASMTERYAHLAPEHLKDALAALENRAWERRG